MSRVALVLRPEPGNAATAARLSAQGMVVRRRPLFAVASVDWSPRPAGFDALLLTSANAVRHAGDGLKALASLPVLAVGTATAAAARSVGLTVAITGATDAIALVEAARQRGWPRLLHLAGRDRADLPGVEAIAVYASEPLPIAVSEVLGWCGNVALLHSPRAARRFAGLVDGAGLARATLSVAALSPAVLDAAGAGWAAAATAATPTDTAIVAAVCALIDPLRPAADNRGMSDVRTTPVLPRRGMHIGAVSVLVALAFLLGLLLAWAMVRRHMARDGGPAVTSLAQPAPVASPSPGPVLAPALPSDPAALASREAVLAGQFGALEQRTASLAASAEAAGGQATRAETLLTAVAARRALDRGLGLGPLDAQLIQRFGAFQPNAVRIVRIAARQPVTLEDLRQGLDAIGPAAAAGVSDGWWATVRRELAGLVVLHRAGTPSPRPAEHLARARRLLEAGQVEAARAEVAQLPGVDDAANWLGAARRYVLARQALDVLENAALAGPPPAPTLPINPAR